MTSIAPWRRVTGVQFVTTKYNRTGEGCNRFFLECGHETVAKASQGQPRKKRCRQCQMEDRI